MGWVEDMEWEGMVVYAIRVSIGVLKRATERVVTPCAHRPAAAGGDATSFGTRASFIANSSREPPLLCGAELKYFEIEQTIFKARSEASKQLSGHRARLKMVKNRVKNADGDLPSPDVSTKNLFQNL